MLAYRYKVWDWGTQRQDGQEDCIKYNLSVTVVAKRHAYNNYEVFNELVCMNLGRAIGLPVPVGMVIEKEKGGDSYYCSGSICSPADEFPPADLPHLAQNQRDLACGVTIFDAWICNDDRHDENIFYDTESGEVFLIDHGQALANIYGPQHLRQNKDELLIRQEFAAEIIDFSSFSYWYKKIVSIPDFMIVEACDQAASVGVEDDEAKEVASLLIERRTKLCQLFKDNETKFPKKEKGLFSPFKCDDDPADYSI